MSDGPDTNLEYPAPLPPMIGKYMVRKPHVAAGLRAIDVAAGVVSYLKPGTPAAPGVEINAILISQCGHLGDLIMTLPTLSWIRANKPHVRIGLMVGSWAAPMMAGLKPLYDRYYVADHFMLDRSDRSRMEKIGRHRTSWAAAAVEIRRDRYDAAFECFPFLQNSIPLLYSCNIPRRLGFTSGGFGPLLTDRAQWKHEARPFLDYHRDLLRMLYSDESLRFPLQPYYPPPTSPRRSSETPYIVVQTGTGNVIKEWPDDRWIQLVRQLRSKGAKIILAGAGKRERERAARIRDAVSDVVDLCDRLSWDEFVALLAQASHVICLDSSTSHLAAALKIPSTVITAGITDRAQFGPAGKLAHVVISPTPCAPCFRGTGCEHMSCVRGVGVEEVFQSVTSQQAHPDLVG